MMTFAGFGDFLIQVLKVDIRQYMRAMNGILTHPQNHRESELETDSSKSVPGNKVSCSAVIL